MSCILDIYNSTVAAYSKRMAFCDETEGFCWKETDIISDSIATMLAKTAYKKSPILLLFDRVARCPISMIGVLKSGNYYVVLDCNQPLERMLEIVKQLDSKIVITDLEHLEIAKLIAAKQIVWENIDKLGKDVDAGILDAIQDTIVDTDLAYVLFTSGSTGTPKGVAISHRNILAYSEWYANTFDLTSNDICGGQTPFYFSMSVSDIYGCIRSGACLQTIPQKLFTTPNDLVKYLCEKRVNSIYWVPAALSIIVNWDAFNTSKPELKRVLFAGENMPCSKLNYWIKHYPNAQFANLFGPTETTDICVYYIIDRFFHDSDILPIGIPCRNCGIVILNDRGDEVSDGEEGELYVYGSFLSPGYYNDPIRTAERFIQNPLNTIYPEILYKTGDIVKRNDKGELVFCGRKDHQIKISGYRVELGEIEAAISTCGGIKECCCIFDEKESIIVCMFMGDVDKKEIRSHIRAYIPRYMIPHKYIKLDKMPHNANGKIDRIYLKETFI